MNKTNIKHEKPTLEEIGDAKTILKNLLKTGIGDTFPGVDDALATS